MNVKLQGPTTDLLQTYKKEMGEEPRGNTKKFIDLYQELLIIEYNKGFEDGKTSAEVVNNGCR